MSLATWLLFTGVPARCVVFRVPCPWPLDPCCPLCLRSVLCARCPWRIGSCSPVCLRGLLCARCPGPLSLCSLVCLLSLLCCVYGVRGHLTSVHRCARSVCCVCGVLGHLASVCRCARWVCCVVCGVSLGTCLVFTTVLARCVVLSVRCPWPLGSCSLVCPLGLLCCLLGVFGHLAPVHRCALSVRCGVRLASSASYCNQTSARVRIADT